MFSKFAKLIVALIVSAPTFGLAESESLRVRLEFSDKKVALKQIKSKFGRKAKVQADGTLTLETSKARTDFLSLQKASGIRKATAIEPEPPVKGLQITSVSKIEELLETYEDAYTTFYRSTHGDKAKVVGEFPGADYLEAYLFFLKDRSYPKDKIDLSAYGRAEQQRSRMRPGTVDRNEFSTEFVNRWQLVGPKDLDIPYTTYYGQPPLGGRFNDVEYDPTNPNTIYVCGAQAGVWKSTDSGANWTPLSDTWERTLTTSIAIHPTNSNILYVGTGDWNGGLGAGVGIRKSTDGGLTWTIIGAAEFAGASVKDIVIDPENPNIVVAAASKTAKSMYRSINGGATWTAVAASSNWSGLTMGALSVGVRPYYATSTGSANTVWRSLDRGASWTVLTSFPAPSNNAVDVAASRINTNILYVLDGSGRKIWKSVDRGGTWSDITGNFPMGTSTNTTYNWSQYTYDFHIHTSSDGVNDVVYVGLIDVAQSPTGSNVWRSIGNAYFSNSKLHNDQHSFGVNPNNPSECLMGGDGGVFRLNYNSGAASWTITPLNEKLGGTTQFYHAAYHPTNAAILIGGTQDNASPASRGDLNHWDNPGAGDGGFAVISQSNPALQYNTSQGLNLYKTTNTWASSSNVSVPNPLSESTPFIAPIYGDPTNGNVLYAGRQSLYRYTNGPNTWEGPLGGVTMSAGGTIRSIAVAASNGNRMYAGSADGKVFRSLDRGATWTNITGTIPNRIIKDIAVDPANADSLLIVLGGASGVARVYQCLNGGSATPTWTSKSGSGGSALPDITHSTVCIDPRAPTTTWYVGADVGAFMTKDAGATWSNITNPLGLPNVRVDELTFVPGQASLYVATHGRGIWRIDTGSTALQALTFSKNPIYSANTLTITVQLTVAAPAGGAVVSLSSNNVGVVAPPIDVIVPQGSNTASVNVAVPYRTADATALITASMNDQQISNTVLVKFLQADINHDGIVDLTDYTRLLNAFDATSASANWDAPCDLNGDGIVDLTDYTIVVVQFNLGGS